MRVGCVARCFPFFLDESRQMKVSRNNMDVRSRRCGCGFVRVRGWCVGTVGRIRFFPLFCLPVFLPCFPFSLFFFPCGQTPKKLREKKKRFVDGPTTPKKIASAHRRAGWKVHQSGWEKASCTSGLRTLSRLDTAERQALSEQLTSHDRDPEPNHQIQSLSRSYGSIFCRLPLPTSFC